MVHASSNFNEINFPYISFDQFISSENKGMEEESNLEMKAVGTSVGLGGKVTWWMISSSQQWLGRVKLPRVGRPSLAARIGRSCHVVARAQVAQ